jgi:hypothetical protein
LARFLKFVLKINKMKKYFLLLILFTISFSCKNGSEGVPVGKNYLFQNPQPINDSELEIIPNKFHGIYINTDSIYLKINVNSIVEESFYRFKIHKTALDTLQSEFDFVDENLISKTTKEIYTKKIIGDSVQLSNKFTDTIFHFSKTQKAKRVHGKLIISEKDSVFWKIKSVFLEKKNLKIQYLYSNKDLIRMDSITKIKSKMIDSASFVITPTRQEFVKIMDLKKIGFVQEFKKIK